MKRIILVTLVSAFCQITFGQGIDNTNKNIYGYNRIITGTSDWLDIQLSGTGSTFQIHDNTNGVNWVRWTAGSSYTEFLTNVILPSSKIGIGTSSPYVHSRLHIKAPSANSWGIIAESSSNDRIIGIGHDGNMAVISSSYLSSGGYSPLQFRTQNIARMTLGLDGNIGIGTTTPYSILEVSPSSAAWGEGIVVNPAPNNYGAIFFRKTTDTYDGSWSVGKSNNDNFSILRQGLTDMTGTSRVETTFEINHSNGYAVFGGNVGIGTSDPKSKLAVEGEIRATRVKVLDDISVPDYVFEDDYELRTLQETKAYIAENKHLPEIPSAAEIGQEGIDLADMNMRLLKKIEELTLYQIQMMEEMSQMKKELEKLKKK